MENLKTNISVALDRVTESVPNEKCRSTLQAFQAKQIWTPQDRHLILETLSKYLVLPNCTIPIGRAFKSLITDLLERELSRHDGKLSLNSHEKLCIAMAKLTFVAPDVLGFAMKYFQTASPFFQRLSDRINTEQQPPKKKSKKSYKECASDLDLAVTAFRFLFIAPDKFRDIWDWSPFMQLLQNEDSKTRWFAAQSMAIVLRMTELQKTEFCRKLFTEEEMKSFSLRCDEIADRNLENALLLTNPTKQIETVGQEMLTHTQGSIVSSDLCDAVTAVCGIVLPKRQPIEESSCLQLVPVPSTLRNLHSLALAIANSQPVLLEGPVGCGKTTLVEYIAAITGRTKTPHLMKVQLGDQTDSKALLGTYRCTDVPGEFVWQPGALTQAVTQGHWILLEDIDYAPMDVVSVLVPLLESNMLSIPGHGDTVRAAPGFQLFASQRLLTGTGGLFKQHNSNSVLLERMWTKISVEPLSRDELHQVILTVYPALATVLDKLLDIYCMLSAGRHDMNTEEGQGQEDLVNVNFHHHEGRLVSTRDLMKWCARIVTDFDVSLSSTANMVFQEALDCFCAVLSKPSTRLVVAEAIGSRINVSKEKAAFLCEKYKPNIDISAATMQAGRAVLKRKEKDVVGLERATTSTFAHTRHATALMERVAVCVANNEPVLLVGETGTGKTSAVQYLAEATGHRLKVINMNQQSDSTDLLGGFKPVDVRQIVAPFREDFESIFCQTFSRKQNSKFLGHIQDCFARKKWEELFKLMTHVVGKVGKKCEQTSVASEELSTQSKWQMIGQRLQQLKTQVKHAQSALAFSFIEGTLVKALKHGDWVLLDEINLATAETLECLSGLLESKSGSVVLLERGDTEPVIRDENFRLFACMNPATDVGKKDLPPGIRNRFTEFFVDELEEVADLKVLVNSYLKGLSLTAAQVDGIVRFYLTVKREAIKKLTDGTGHRPHYSLRTLCRALRQAAINPYGNIPRCLYESFCLSFLTQLDRASHPVVEQLICHHILGRSNIKGVLKQPLPPPTGGHFTKMEGYWVSMGENEPILPRDYILTKSVRANLRDLSRIVSAGRYPVLLQGETSVGKTSLVNWLARATGNHCVRVNNHEHTDLQEYVGFYAADETGKLVFKEGVLVDAMRKGYWIILDELNLAPSDVLEALNRLLDDNRELFIPETQETVKAHARFMLFATQNPPGLYGGRKVLSRAFRNRFVELHFDEIPSLELETILHQRCSIPLSYCKRMVAVMLELQARRRGSGVFAGKQGYITLRDLFRWAERYRQASKQTSEKFYDWDQHIADEGYMLLAGKVRKEEESSVILEVLQKHIKRTVDPRKLFSLCEGTSTTAMPILQKVIQTPPDGFSHVVWTHSMRRLAVLAGQAMKFGEPVLLVGDTGCGKTTICQLFAALAKQQLYTVNCHLHTETSDFLGGLRPVRHRTSEEGSEENQRLFEWCDGPLVLAMREGAAFLVDEISLADDSVLERLNSVLEPERTLLLAEKGSGESIHGDVEQIVAMETFRVVATMNPGGDFGKKELSPALRNRFTEIWCPQSNSREDLVNIIEHNLTSGLQLCNQEDGSSGIGNAIMDFIEWFSNNEVGARCTVSIRDVLSWVHFINTVCTDIDSQSLDTATAYIHGACLVFLDGLGTGTTSSSLMSASEARSLCLQNLQKQMYEMAGQRIDLTSLTVSLSTDSKMNCNPVILTDDVFGIDPFFIPRGPCVDAVNQDQYALHAPTTAMNAQRLLRGLQLPKALLLEGSPGVGKTSLVTALAKASGHEYVRINLSEQTDVTDLFGADLPVEGGQGGQFAWRDGPLLRALKAGHWVVLDELNLASQSVLEGLNACLDHRAEVFVPELGKTFQIQHMKTRIFACQNPLNQGGGRKGLPRSFLNRFTQVHIEPLSAADLLFITNTMYPMLDVEMLKKMIEFNNQLYTETMVNGLWGQRGGPWEFNLRDLFRWCDLMVDNQDDQNWNPGEYVGLIYSERMRTRQDKDKVLDLFKTVFCQPSSEGTHWTEPYQSSRHFHITSKVLQVGHSFLQRSQQANQTTLCLKTPLKLLHHVLEPMEALMKCIEMNWMAILVGPHSSGKTSLVQLVAELTGQRLQVMAMNSAMDTTELLGGFEQADLNRHMEQLMQSLQSVVLAVMRSVLLVNDKKSHQFSQHLLNSWSTLLDKVHSGSVRNSGSLDTVQDSISQYGLSKEVFRCVDKMLSMVEKHCRKYNITLIQDVSSLKSRFEELQHRFEKEGQHDGSGGGRFEWVDGLLVQALQNGDWLLIDNVNFCSPSVLDRLNALLEPNGVLSINERGVIDGEIPTIKPHQNFRLILAMDPRHGEISRAMRNRGVELYILGENESGQLGDFDVKSLLHGIGLVGKKPCDVLMKLHSALKSTLTGPEPCSLLDLLHTASLTVQELQRGNDVISAMLAACTNVYVRGQRSYANRQVAKETIEDHILRVDLESIELETSTSIILDQGQWPDSLPAVLDYSQHSEISMMKRQTVVFVHLLNQLSMHSQTRKEPLTLSELLGKKLKPVESDETSHLWNLLLPATLILIELSTQNDWQLRKRYLCDMVEAKLPVRQHATFSSASREEFGRYLPDIVVYVINIVHGHTLMERLQNVFVGIGMSESDLEVLATFPYDVQWNQQLRKNLLTKINKKNMTSIEDGTIEKTDFEVVNSLLNRLYIVLKKAVRDYMENTVYQMVDKKQQAHSAIQLSYAFNNGLVSMESLPDPIIAHLYPFFVKFNGHIETSLQADSPLTDTATVQIFEALQWRDRFWDVSNEHITARQQFTLSQLKLHWSWVYKKTLMTVTKLLAGKDTEFPVELNTIVSRIQHTLGQDGRASQIHLHVWKDLGFPIPYKSSVMADMMEHVLTLCQSVDVQSSGSNMAVVKAKQEQEKRIRFVVGSDGRQVCHHLTNILLDGYCANESAKDNIDTLLDRIDQVESKLSQYQLYEDQTTIPMEVEDTEKTTVPVSNVSDTVLETQVQLWPLYDQMTLLHGCRLVTAVLGGELRYGQQEFQRETSISDNLRSLLNYLKQWTLTKPQQLALYTRTMQSVCSDQSLSPIRSEVMMNFLKSQWTASVAKYPYQWLSWKPSLAAKDDASVVKRNNPYDINYGPGSLYLSCVGSFTFDLLLPRPSNQDNSNQDNSNRSDSDGQSIQAKSWNSDGSHDSLLLGMFREKLEQVHQLTEFLWTNGGSLSTEMLHYRVNNWNSLSANLANLIHAMRSFVSEVEKPRLDCAAAVLLDFTGKRDSDSLTETIATLPTLFHYGGPEAQNQEETVLPEYVKELLEGCIQCLQFNPRMSSNQLVCVDQSQAVKTFDHLTDQLHCGTGWIHLGLLQTLLLSPQGPVDPAEKTAMKLKYINSECEEIQCELEVRNQTSELLTGLRLEEMQKAALPSRVRYLQERLVTLNDLARDLAKKTAIRPDPPRFDALLQEVHHFTSSVGSLSTVQNLQRKLEKSFKNQARTRGKHSYITNLLNEEKAWQSSVHQFIKRIEDEYPLYRDLTIPFLTGVLQLSHGMRTVAHAVYCKNQQVKVHHAIVKSDQINSVQDLLQTLVRFPTVTESTPTSLSVAEALCDKNTLQLIENITNLTFDTNDVDKPGTSNHKDNLLKIALLHTRNHAINRGELDVATRDLVKDLFDAVVDSLKHTEELARLKEEQEAQLFKYRTKVHGDGLTEEEREEREFRKTFPTFHKDFEDLTDPPSLERKESDPEDIDGTKSDSVVKAGKLDATEMSEMCRVHQLLYCGLTRTSWLQPGHGMERYVDYSEPISIAYQMTARLVQSARSVTDASLDSSLLGSHLLMSYLLHSSAAKSESKDPKENVSTSILFNKPFDIYYDSHVEEAVQCRPVLEKLTTRIQELLSEWPEHPTLKQLVEIISRIMAFPITSPLMKFVTGLEVLLEKAQEWESNASRQVSVQTHLDSITQMIIQWRKIELSCWSSCLNMVVYKYVLKACRRWYHLYQLVEYYLAHPQDSDEGCDVAMGEESVALATSDELHEKEASGINKFVRNLQQFMEGTSLGEFSCRLQMMMAFHCQAVQTAETPEQGKVVNILWNVYQYYKQFLPAVEAKIQELRKPIEKELKGFVKIARWSDMNFWAMKQYVEKSHRTLHKYRKKFESALLELARNVFTDSNIGNKENQNQQTLTISQVDMFVSPHSMKDYFDDLDESSPLEGILPRLPSLFSKMTKLCHKMFKTSYYPELITSIDDFTGDVIDTVHQLQALDVTKDADKNKQKSEAKHINVRKRKALSDLFKYLSTIGLSYRKGLTSSQQSDQHQAMHAQPIDINTAFMQTTTRTSGRDATDAEMSAFWEGCQHYYYRCIARKASLYAALVTPSKELGVANIDRVKGFTEHLIQIVTKQREELSLLVSDVICLRKQLFTLEHFKSSVHSRDSNKVRMPVQKELHQWICTTKDLADKAQNTLQQVKLVLQCCPEKREKSVYPSPTLPCQLAKIELARKGNDTWNEVSDELQASLSEVSSIKAGLDEASHRMSLFTVSSSPYLYSWSEVTLLQTVYSKLQVVYSSLEKIESFINLPETQSPAPMFSSVTVIKDDIRSKLTELEVWLGKVEAPLLSTGENDGEDRETDVIKKYQGDVEEFVTKILVTIQKLVKSRKIREVERKDDEDENIEEDDDADEKETEDLAGQLQEDHLKRLQDNGLTVDKGYLDIEKVTAGMVLLVNDLSKARDDCTTLQDIQVCDRCLAYLLHVVPLLHQYVGVVNHHLTTTLASHRSSCKLLSVLLGVFTELASKGFCIPAEFSDEAGGEGSTQFEDIEGAGMGEGEGVKDVSDQIENEDQVQDVKKQDEENKEDNFDDQPDLQDEEEGIEMSEDFEGKLHDVDKSEQPEGSGDESEGEDEEKLDKQMGEVDGEENEKLDERMWGDDEDEETEEEKKEEKDEVGPGMDEEESKMVAKDDNKDAVDDDEKGNKGNDEQEQKEQEQEEVQPHNLEPKDESEFDDDKIDPSKANLEPPENTAEELDLPDDLNLDEKAGNESDDNEEKAEQEENPFDIETKPDTLVEERGDDESMDEEESDPTEENKQTDDKDEIENKDEDGGEQQDDDDRMDVEEQGGDGKEEEDLVDDEETNKEKGLHPQIELEEEDTANDEEKSGEDTDVTKETTETAENYAKTKTSQDPVELSEDVEQHAGKNEEEDKKEEHGTGTAEAEKDEGHEGDMISDLAHSNTKQQKQHQKNKPGQSNADRSLGSTEEKIEKRLKTIDNEERSESRKDLPQDEEGKMESDLYEHIKDSSHHDTQTLDAATQEQQQEQQAVPNVDSDSDVDAMETDDEETIKPVRDAEDDKEPDQTNSLTAAQFKNDKESDDTGDGEGDGKQCNEEEDKKTAADTVGHKSRESTIHTARDVMMEIENQASDVDVEKLRTELELQLTTWTHSIGSAEEDKMAQEAWLRYESLTSSLSQELCEQLRLVLEPSQATKLRGDYRTGKRLNMRKVIPYIASQFRKDKIWLRRTKPSKRNYQIMLAVDDSSSMADNHSKQLAFESLAVISNALTWLEAGELAVCSFGETVQLLHPFHEQFTSQSGARILQQFTFEQKKTKIAQLVDKATGVMLSARSRQHPGAVNLDTSQLLLIVSDGRGLFLEGMEAVKSVVRAAKEAHVFTVFVVLDNPDNKDSILDIKVPVFKGAGEMPDIRLYMEQFPFPFYIILRDINALPATLSDALRQWFELVTADTA